MATFKFAQWTLHATEIFYKTKLSLGFVNLKPVLPGHVLIIPLRVVPRFADLTKDEITDMWSSAQIIGSVIERQFGGESLTFTIQVPHVHIHILPRKKLDFQENDEIYEAIDKRDHVIRARTQEEMAAEAAMLAPLFKGTPGDITNGLE